TEECFSFEGRHFQLKDVRLTPKPARLPRPPIWMAARAEAPIRRAARFADGIIAVGAPDLIRRYRDAVRDAGKDPAAATVAVLRSVVIDDDPERAWNEVRQHVAWRNTNYGEWYGQAGDLPQDVRRLDQLRSGAADPAGAMQSLIKDADAAARDVAELEQMGVDAVIYFATFPGHSPVKMLPTWEALARKV